VGSSNSVLGIMLNVYFLFSKLQNHFEGFSPSEIHFALDLTIAPFKLYLSYQVI